MSGDFWIESHLLYTFWMIKLLKKHLHRIVNSLGYEIVHSSLSVNPRIALGVAIRNNPGIQTVIDIGASDGRWTSIVEKIIPKANFLLFEAAPFHFSALKQLEKKENYFIEYLAASDHMGTVNFHLDSSNPLGGGANSVHGKKHPQPVPSNTIDNVVSARNLVGPFILKLDTQGHEVEILSGAKQTLNQTKFIVMEVYTIDEPGRLAFDEICLLLRGYGFRAAGIMGILNRPIDGVWWQADFVFIRDSSPVFKNFNFRSE